MEKDSTRQGTGAMAAIAATDCFKEFGIQSRRFSGKALGGGGEGVYRRKVVEKGVRFSSPGTKKSSATTDENRKAGAKKGGVHKVEKSRQSARARSLQLTRYNHYRGFNSMEWVKASISFFLTN